VCRLTINAGGLGFSACPEYDYLPISQRITTGLAPKRLQQQTVEPKIAFGAELLDADPARNGSRPAGQQRLPDQTAMTAKTPKKQPSLIAGSNSTSNCMVHDRRLNLAGQAFGEYRAKHRSQRPMRRKRKSRVAERWRVRVTIRPARNAGRWNC
jgi:hypothetical protein